MIWYLYTRCTYLHIYKQIKVLSLALSKSINGLSTSYATLLKGSLADECNVTCPVPDVSSNYLRKRYCIPALTGLDPLRVEKLVGIKNQMQQCLDHQIPLVSIEEHVNVYMSQHPCSITLFCGHKVSVPRNYI